MKKFWQVLTLFPEMFKPFTELGVTRRAFTESVVFQAIQLRSMTTTDEPNVDDRPFGGGPGMVMRAEPILKGIQMVKQKQPTYVVLLSPQGNVFCQKDAKRLAQMDSILFLCGRYEGLDERVLAQVDEEISIGDVVLTGGELPAMVIMDAMSRYIPGVVGCDASVEEDSFASEYRLDHPHYTRPRVLNGVEVPEVLVGGDHALIAKWRKAQRAQRTRLRRPDLLVKQPLSATEKDLLENFCEE